MLAAPLAALIWWPRRAVLLALAAPALLYIGWQAPVRDVAAVAGDPSTTTAYYQPLLRFLSAQPGGRARQFRIEIPFTNSHWEADRVATRFPLARGWERQLDVADNPVFYDGRLNAATYERWLHRNAVRFVALPDARLDYSARAEGALIRSGLPYLRPVMRSAHWRVFAVADPTPIAQGAATLTAMGPDWIALRGPPPRDGDPARPLHAVLGPGHRLWVRRPRRRPHAGDRSPRRPGATRGPLRAQPGRGALAALRLISGCLAPNRN